MGLDLDKEISNYIETHLSIFNQHCMMKFTALGSRGLERKLISHFESHFQDLQRRLLYKGHEKGLRIIWLSV